MEAGKTLDSAIHFCLLICPEQEYPTGTYPIGIRYHYVGITERVVWMKGDTRTLAAIALIAWLFVVLFFMILALQINLEIFFVLWLIGLLVLTELTDTRYTLPRHLKYIRYLIAAGVVVFGVVVARKVMEILST